MGGCLSRFRRFATACGLVLLSATAVAAGDALQEALAASAVPIRSIDPRDTGYADLLPLISSIGDARVVLLGEPSHGSGGAFAAKVRLIRFLHQRMGFDVVAWESGMHALQATEAALDGNEDPVSAARRGIFPIWSAAEEVRPLFEYARATRSTPRPLAMAGIDVQFTAPGAADYLASDLRAFLAAPADAELRRHTLSLADTLLAASGKLRQRPQPPASTISLTEADRDAVTRPADALLAALQERRPEFLRTHSGLRIEFIEHSIENLRADALNTWERRRGVQSSDGWNRRDTRMAANLRWLLDQRFRGRKIVVWGHNAHLMHAWFAANWAAVAHEPVAGGMAPLGALLTQQPGVYAMAFTTFEGEENWTNGQKRGVIAPAPQGSLEARLHAIGNPYAFVDLRAVSRRLSGAVGPVSLRISGFGPPTAPYGNDVVPDLARAFDGVFYIDRMSPATAAAQPAP